VALRSNPECTSLDGLTLPIRAAVKNEVASSLVLRLPRCDGKIADMMSSVSFYIGRHCQMLGI
jgi:hypothetical protein